MRCRAVPILVSLLALSPAQGPPANGPRAVDPGWFALRNARVVTAPGQVLDVATVVVRDGRIVSVGKLTPPAGATVVDYTGLVIYPGLIEPFLPTDVPALDPTAADQHWNPSIQPQRSALDGALVPAADRTALRSLGFTAAAIAPSGGILKGSSSVVQLDEPEPTAPTRIVRRLAYQLASLQTRADGYPNSEMGAIALLRQTLEDGLWYERCLQTIAAQPGLAPLAPRPSAALQAMVDQRALPLWFDVQDELEALRVLRIGKEFDRTAVIVGSGMEFRRLAALAAKKVPIVVPVHFPDPPDVSTAAAAEAVSLRQLQSWEQAPTNSKRLLDAGLPIAWTTARLRDRKDFTKNVQKAMACGITADQALAAVTTVPAELLGVQDRLGTIAPGKLANLTVVAGELFGEKATVRDVWVGGVRHAVDTSADEGLDGSWAWSRGWPGTAPDAEPRLEIDGEHVRCKVGDVPLTVAGVVREPMQFACRLQGPPLAQDGTYWLRCHREGADLAGTCTAPDGRTSAVRATRTVGETKAPDDKPGKTDKQDTAPSLDPLPTPLGGYGFLAVPAATEFALVGATLWPSDGRGVVRDGAVIVRDGRITFAGARSDMPALRDGVKVIDATGKHVTPGIIDCHSHTGISRGVNESGQAVTAEVRVQDVIDADDVNWYRELAGGVTAVNQLHGSANAIGGQSCTVKVRYGVPDPDDMRLAGAPAGIKWALGENPRRANGSETNPRYPNTRMGVEALLRDRLAAAAAYQRERADYERLAPAARAKVLPPRRDLELDALAEVLAGTRRVHCHSYRQDEIFMLCHLAQEHGFEIGTFQHVLEGYKVADAIAAAAIGASSFSDWWGYKFEVYDAIPENGAILHEAGVLVSYNSDSNEHARRLNTEAGKAVKYGGVEPAEALCFVTRNPAMQLGIFERTGSLTAGKDADIALWSADPLGYAARCEATWVDGRLLFSLAGDAQARASIASERQRLLQKAINAGNKGRTAKEGDPKDAYWAAQDLTSSYCCRNEGGR
ncbi:MAG TPA: amidohydrolase family protein [Planctomycetota bacterium]|nr:amidohydrolase family protein [Planctomycetota bacterium]